MINRGRWIAMVALLVALGCSDDDKAAGGLDASADSSGGADAAGVSLFGTRYCEVLLVKVQGTTATIEVHNTVGLNLCPASQWDALDSAKLKQQHNAFAAILNGPRYWAMDWAKGGNSSSTINFGGIEMRKAVAKIKMPLAEVSKLASKEYTSITVLRDNTWIYNAGREVYELVDPDGKVYVMQSYSQQVDKALSTQNLPKLGARLKPPKGWSYRARKLTARLEVRAGGQATVVQDELKNTYQLR